MNPRHAQVAGLRTWSRVRTAAVFFAVGWVGASVMFWTTQAVSCRLGW